MKTTEFLTQFQLLQKTNAVNDYPYPGKLKPAAVLIPLIERDNELQVLLTERSAHLKHHAGQISFPGGRYEESDNTMYATALRESEEEIGLDPRHVSIIGKLHQYRTITGYEVTPVVALVSDNLTLELDSNEVASTFEVPLTYLFDRSNHLYKEVSRNGQVHKIYFIPYKNWNIWGATAALLIDLVNHLKN